jgi:hypothetical protein
MMPNQLARALGLVSLRFSLLITHLVKNSEVFTMKNKILGLIALGILSTFTSELMAQTTATQKFTVSVPTNISITAPANVALTHNETDSDQAFPAQQWVVKGNSRQGVTVSFSTGSAFVHTTDNTFKRNAQLALSVGSSTGPATWTINQGTDVTDYAGGDGVATVQASSNNVGRANFNLAVTFITDTFGTFASGDYETTVTGTVTAN